MKKLLLILLFLTFSNLGFSSEKNSTDVDFSSDELEVDELKNIMIAKGNVIIKGNNLFIKADKVTYFKNNDKAIAKGNVLIKSTDGSIFESKEAILTKEFNAFTLKPLYGTFVDKSQMKGEILEKQVDGTIIFKNSSYTACNCDYKNETNKPAWELSSKEIKRDIESKTIYYNSVTLKLFSVPILYLPYMSHADWTVNRRSGLLEPSFGYSNKKGLTSSVPYYFVTDDESWELIYTNHIKGNNGHLNQINFKKLFKKSDISLELYQGILDSENKNNDGVFASKFNFKTDLDDTWKINGEYKYTEQDTFMRRYGFDNEDIYKSYIKAEKVTKNKIQEIEFYDIKNLIGDEDSYINQPQLSPYINHLNFINSDNSYGLINFNFHDIKGDEGYDVQRWTGNTKIGTNLNFGKLNLNLDGEAGLDLYAINGRPLSDNNDNKYLDRMSFGSSFSMDREFITGSYNNVSIKPKIQISSIFSTDRRDDIPNRDSIDFRLDEANLFEINQFQGRDNIQTNQKINYGIESLILYGDDSEFGFFLGQSQRIGGSQENTIDNNPQRKSDFVNNINWKVNEKTSLALESIIDEHSLDTNFSNLELNINLFETKLSFSHRSIDNSLVSGNENREELKFAASKKFDEWKLIYNSTFDLKNNESEQINETFRIEYESDYLIQNCLSITLDYTKSNFSDRDIESEDSILLSINFRNLGNYKFIPKLF